MRKFGKVFVQIRRQANEVKDSFNDVIHEAEREFELERIRELRDKLQSTSPQQVLDAVVNENLASPSTPLLGPGLDEHGHPLAGHDIHGYPLEIGSGGVHAANSEHENKEYGAGHYVDGQFVPNSDTFLAWDPSMAELRAPDPDSKDASEIANDPNPTGTSTEPKSESNTIEAERKK
jgi:hypothetical protein